MAQIAELKNGNKIIEFFGPAENETAEQLSERMHKAGLKKLRDPRVKEFYEVQERNHLSCPCGNGTIFRYCCFKMINKGPFEVDHKKKASVKKDGEQMDLFMWSNEFDFVIAESADEARQLVMDHYGIEDYEGGEFEQANEEQEFTLRLDDGQKETKRVRDWIAEFGKSYFACTEY
ncbi:MAG: hypothetical protein ACYS1A_17435 [Planctomycetota bacterium]